MKHLYFHTTTAFSMDTSCALFLCVALTVFAVTPVISTANVQCGIPAVQPSSFRIVGGQEARPGALPWTVVLAELNFPVCSGAILNNHVILTAAHCFEESVSQDPRRWTVVAGKHRVDKYEPTQRTYHVQKIVMHKHYDKITVVNDIALLLLKEMITYTNYIKPVCLPSDNQPLKVGETCLVAGWGDTLGTGKSTVLNQVSLPVLSDDTCGQPDWYGATFFADTVFCAGYATGGKDACTGDSGSPLICEDNGQWYVQGVTSWGYGCAEPKWPGLYTQVEKYTQWIQQAMSNLGHPYSSTVG